MGKDMIAGGAVLGAIIIIILDILLGIVVGLRYWVEGESTALIFALGIAFYNHFPANIYMSIVICAVAGLLAGATAKGPLYGIVAGIGAYIGSIIGIIIIAGAASTLFPPMFGIGAFQVGDVGKLILNSLIWGVWAIIGLGLIGGYLNKESKTRG